MKRTLIGVAIASVVLFFWGFLYWGMGPYKTMIWKHAKDDAAAGAALREHFPQNGTYLVPGFANDDATMEALSKKGPVALVNMIAVEGANSFDPLMLLKGFVLNLIVIVLIAILLRRVASSLPSYKDRVMFVALAGLTATVLIDGGDIAWWHISWTWKLYQAFYSFSFWVIAGLILARFVVPKTA
ncbi:MAG TPA: hypothetical protein VGP63_03045 [Planctomycetaceae bacterium]|nr:hypothetical protein [Planctomycetaceae bacterium]